MIAKGYMSKWCHEYEIWDPHVLLLRVEALGADRCAADLMSSSTTVLQMILSGKCTPVSQCNKCLFASRTSAPLFNQVLPFNSQRCKWCNTAEPWWDVTFPTLHWRLNDSCHVMRLCSNLKPGLLGMHTCSEHVCSGSNCRRAQHIASLPPTPVLTDMKGAAWAGYHGNRCTLHSVAAAVGFWCRTVFPEPRLDTIAVFNGMLSILLSLLSRPPPQFTLWYDRIILPK